MSWYSLHFCPQLFLRGRKSKAVQRVGSQELEVFLVPVTVRNDLSWCHQIRDVYRSLVEAVRSQTGLGSTDYYLLLCQETH